MLKESDERWLRANYSTLVWNAGGITGNLSFRASYNSDLNRFVILGEQEADDLGAVVLSGDFKIRIVSGHGKSVPFDTLSEAA
jgi:hypothetical protein